MNIGMIDCVLYALGIGAAIGGVAAYIGSLMVTKRMALMAGALGHLTLPGIALALHFGFDITIGALLFLGFGIIAIWYLEQKTKLPTEAVTALVFASSLAVAFLFLPLEESHRVLLGDINAFSICKIARNTYQDQFFVNYMNNNKNDHC